MYTVLIQDDNSVIATVRQRIMQNSNLVDSLRIIVPKMYNDIDLSGCTAYLEYLTPINHRHNYIELEIANAEYETDYILYQISFDANLTSEVGNLKFYIHFIQVEMNEDGEVKTPVRQTDEFTIPIIPIADWFSKPEELLNAFDKKLIEQQEIIKAMADLQSTISSDKIDDIKLDPDTNSIYGTSGGEKKGKGIDLSELGDAIANSTEDGMIVVNTYEDDGEDDG